jgi:hypothetical protein
MFSSHTPLFSANSVPSVLESPRSHPSQLSQLAKQPTAFPLFPHPVNMAHTRTPANLFPSIVYFTLLCRPGDRVPTAAVPSHSHPRPLPSPTLRPPTIPLDATLTKNKGVGIPTPRATGSEPSARNNPSPSIPVFPFDSKLSTACPEPRRVDLVSLTRSLTSSNKRKSPISNTYKKQGASAELHAATVLTIHYPLLTSPILPLNYCLRGTP